MIIYQFPLKIQIPEISNINKDIKISTGLSTYKPFYQHNQQGYQQIQCILSTLVDISVDNSVSTLDNFGGE